jgi:hypothetical protein
MPKIVVSLFSLGLLTAACTQPSGGEGGGGPEATGGSKGTGGSKASGGSGIEPGATGGTTGTATGGSSGTATGGAPAGSGGASPGSGGAAASSGGAAGGAAGGSGGGSGGAPGSDTSPPPVTSDPKAPCPRCVRIFNGTNFDGWEAAPGTWTIVDGAMRGFGGTSRAAYTKADYGNVRLIVTSRLTPANGDHLGILFWGDRPADPAKPKIDLAGWVQWMPPFGGMWSYHAPMHHGLSAMKVATTPAKSGEWHTSELLLNLDKGTLRAAVNGLETTRYTHAWPTERVDPTKKIIKGPIAMMKHGGGGSEYKDIWVEVDPDDQFVTVK